LIAAACLFLVHGATDSAYAQDPLNARFLDKPIKSFKVVAPAVSVALQRLANENDVPIGFEAALPGASSATKEPGSIRISVESGTVRDVLNAIVAAEPIYVWREMDGVINVLPRQHADSLLDVVLSRFEVNQVGKGEARRTLLATLEVKRWMVRTGVQERTFFTLPGGTGEDSAPISLNLTNVSVRTVLNTMLRTGAFRYWVYSPYKFDDRQFFLLTTT